jgi:diacylglycerol O-acyltransferase / wax synthase
MPPTRLSALDASFLAAETPTAHMHVGWAAIFAPPEDGRRPTFEQLRTHIDGRLDRAPRYRQKLAQVPFGVHDPLWVDDCDFDIANHVQEADGGDIDTIVANVMSTPLERSRPMWECWVAPELDDGRIGVVGKVHHCMVDGLAAVELAALLLDGEPDAPEPDNRNKWEADITPNGASRLVRGLLDRSAEMLDVARRPLAVLTSPRRIADAAAEGGRIASALRNSFANPARPTGALNPPLSPLRHLARFERPLDDLMRIKEHFGTTVNDVVLAACAGAVRDFLVHHEEPAFAVKAMVPVTQRSADQAAGLGNRISFLFIDLPSDEADPVTRLRTIHATTKERKESGEAHGGDLVLNALGYAPHAVQRQLTKLVASPRTFNLVVSNIPGPPAPMWMRGCALEEAYPIVPLADRHAVAIGMTTLPGKAFFGLYADRKMLPDADALANDIDYELDELLAHCGPSGNGHRRSHGKRRTRAPVGAN